MIRYLSFASDRGGACSIPKDSMKIGKGLLSVDAGQNPVLALRSDTGKAGALIVVNESGPEFGKKIQIAIEKAHIR